MNKLFALILSFLFLVFLMVFMAIFMSAKSERKWQEREKAATWEDLKNERKKEWAATIAKNKKAQAKRFSGMSPGCKKSCEETIKNRLGRCLKRCEEDFYDKDLLGTWDEKECKDFCEYNTIGCDCIEVGYNNVTQGL